MAVPFHLKPMKSLGLLRLHHVKTKGISSIFRVFFVVYSQFLKVIDSFMVEGFLLCWFFDSSTFSSFFRLFRFFFWAMAGNNRRAETRWFSVRRWFFSFLFLFLFFFWFVLFFGVFEWARARATKKKSSDQRGSRRISHEIPTRNNSKKKKYSIKKKRKQRSPLDRLISNSPWPLHQ